MKVTVLAGGTSAEREVSLNSALCVVQALRKNGHTVTVLDPGTGWREIDPGTAPPATPQKICGLPEAGEKDILTSGDIVFNVLHGGQGENGTVCAVLELLGVPYVGGGPGASAAAMDKVVSKRLFSAVGVPVPDYFVLNRPLKNQWQSLIEAGIDKVGLPAVVKPSEEGSTVGLTKAETLEQVYEAVELAAKLSRQVLVEKFIEGRELTVGVLGDEALPVLEVVIPGGFYDFEAKYHSQENKYICPAEIDSGVAERAQQLALEAFHVLGLEDYARIDFRVDKNNGLWCLEANNQPGMTDHSLLPKAALVTGLDLTALLERLIKNALTRFRSGRS